MRNHAIAEYHELLKNDPGLTPELFARLHERMKLNLLSYGDRPLGVALRPHFLTRPQFDKLATASETLYGAFEKLGAALLENPAMLEDIGLLEQERRLALVEPGFRYSAVTSRLDAFIHNDEVKFVEYNAENPSSLSDQGGLNDVLFELEAMQIFGGRYRLQQFDPPMELLTTLLETFREWGGAGQPQIAILDWADLPTSNEFILLRNYFAARGVPTVVCTPDELEYTHGKLHRADFRIDLVYKRIIIHEFLSRYDETHPLVRAYIKGDVCLVNPFRCKLLHKKACFALLTDEAHQHLFSKAEQNVLSACVPWTRRVRESNTTRQDRSVDLIEHIRANRGDFVIKPNDDYGGVGIFLGHRSTESQWDSAISTALDGDFVVQEIIELHTEEFPIFTDQQWSIEPMFIDTNPFLFRGKVEGALVRLSDSPIVNVTSGGGETGFFVLEGQVR